MPRRRRQDLNPDPAKLAKAPPPLGTDLAFSLPAADGKPFVVSFWDLWFAMITARECGGDLDRLARLLTKNQPYMSDREGIERKISHLRDLQERLHRAGLTIDQILAAAGALVRQEARRAQGRVLEHKDREREWSEPMRVTPRQRRRHHALRGFWPGFPVSPLADAHRMAPHFRTTRYFTENQSFALARTIDTYFGQAETFLAAGKLPEAQALFRAIVTVVIEVMAVADDSCGSIGDAFQQAFKLYLSIPPASTGIEDTVFLADLLSLLIWEDYGLTWKQTDGYFARLSDEQARWCIDFLRREVDGLKADGLNYSAEQALTLMGQVAAEKSMFELFEGLATEMGSREWHRIIQLADVAMSSGKQVLARRVFEAALTPGPHQEFLARKYEQLKQGRWNPDPKT